MKKKKSYLKGIQSIGMLILLVILICACGVLIASPKSKNAETITATIIISTETPSPIPSPTTTPDAIQDIRDRFQNPKLMFYDEYTSIDVLVENEVLKIFVTRKAGDLWGFESLQDISIFLHSALVDCTEYRFGHGIDGCTIKETAPYKYVELREYMPSGELKAYVRFTVGDKKYFSGFDGTRIIESQLFEIADESFLQP